MYPENYQNPNWRPFGLQKGTYFVPFQIKPILIIHSNKLMKCFILFANNITFQTEICQTLLTI